MSETWRSLGGRPPTLIPAELDHSIRPDVEAERRIVPLVARKVSEGACGEVGSALAVAAQAGLPRLLEAEVEEGDEEVSDQVNEVAREVAVGEKSCYLFHEIILHIHAWRRFRHCSSLQGDERITSCRIRQAMQRRPFKKGKTRSAYSPSRTEIDKRTGGHTARFARDFGEHETKGFRELRVCRSCHAVYFDEHWHAWQRAKVLAERLKRMGARETICAECRWARDAKRGQGVNYEGEVLLSGWRTTDEKVDILQLVRNIGKRATLRDPEDQIIRIEDNGDRVRILTTENQLAVGIGKQVDRARKGGKLDIVFSHGDAPVRVRWMGPAARK